MQFLFKKLVILSLVLSCLSCSVKAQFLMDMVDTTTEIGKGILSIYRQYNGLRFSGYVQPQYQVIQTKGAKSFNAGDFPPNVDNRFMIRRGRLRVDYVRLSNNKSASGQFVFQIDATERRVFVRDLWGRVFENRAKLFSLTVGMFARPFGYELNLSSSDRESPERGRMSQTLMKTERDLGAMVSFEPRGRTTWLKFVKLDAGFFNG